jgi:hypothetical protein
MVGGLGANLERLADLRHGLIRGGSLVEVVVFPNDLSLVGTIAPLVNPRGSRHAGTL